MPDVNLVRGGKLLRAIQDPEALKRFGNFLRSTRIHRGMTQKDVAYKLGITSASTISDWERAVSAPSTDDVLYGLMDIFVMNNQELGHFYDLGDDSMKKALRNDERVQKMLELRKLGMTNKQIAQELGCGVTTVYENIGKRSMDVRKAAEQNKPCPVPEIQAKKEKVDALLDRMGEELEKKFKENGYATPGDVMQAAGIPCADSRTIGWVRDEPYPDIPIAVEVKPIEPEQPKEEAKGRSWEETKAHIQSLPPADLPKRKIGSLAIRKEVRILELDGVACNYRVNTGTGDIELVSFGDRASLVEGLLDKSNLDAMIGELQTIRTLL